MGLRQLEWHEQKNNGWVARTMGSYFEGKGRPLTTRYAHVNIVPLGIKPVQGKVFVEFISYFNNYEQSWHDSIEAAKLHVEAIFALDN
jgi:hypothetical protein